MSRVPDQAEHDLRKCDRQEDHNEVGKEERNHASEYLDHGRILRGDIADDEDVEPEAAA